MSATWIAIVLAVSCLISLLLYAGFSLRRLGMPTRGDPIDRAARPNRALVVIDVQEDFTRNTGRHAYDPGERDRVLAAIGNEIEKARSSGDDVVFVRNVFRGWPVVMTMKLVAGGIGTPGRDGLRIDRAISVGTDPVFEKSIGDSFSSPDFERFLQERKIGRLTLVGLDACHCVQLTARGALARGFDVMVMEPLLLTTTPEKWPALKRSIGEAGAVLA